MELIMKTSHTFKSCVISLAVALSIPVSGFCEKSFEHTVSFDITEFSTDTVTCDSSKYISIRYGNMFNGSGEVGDPAIPIKIVSLSVPQNATGFKVEVVSKNGAVTRQLPYIIEPITLPQTTGGALDTLLVQSGTPVPLPLPKEYLVTPVVTNEDYADGCNHIVTVALAPLDYKTTSFSKRVTLYENIVLRVSYEDCSAEQLAVKPLVPGVMQSQAYIKTLVDNPASVRINSPAPNTDSSDNNLLPYFIITSEKLRESFEDLALWKQQKGYDVKIVTMDSIYASPYVEAGDTISGMNDNAGKLRAYITHLFKTFGKSFVLLGGDHTQVPIRYAKSSELFPSDWYFSELNSDWDPNKDGVCSEFYTQKNIGGEPEMVVSRLICSQPYHVSNYTDKLLRYEGNPGNGNIEYLGHFIGYQLDMFKGYLNQNAIALNLNMDAIIMLEDPSYWPSLKGTYFMNALNASNYGFVSFNGHGGPECVVTSQRKSWEYVGIYARQYPKLNALKYPNKSEEFPNSYLDIWNNKDYPAIGYSTSCTSSPFDYDDHSIFSIKDTIDVEYSFGSSYTCGKNYGGPAFIGNTRKGFLTGSSELFEFFSSIIPQNSTIGIAQNIARGSFIKNNEGYYRYCGLVNHLIGEPEFDMWVGVPQTNSTGIVALGNTLKIEGNIFEGTRMTIFDGNNTLSKICETNSIDLTPFKNKCISFWKTGQIPNILFIGSGLMDQSGSSKYIVNNAYLGSIGDNTFEVKNRDLTLHALKKIVADKFKVSNKGNVTLSCFNALNMTGAEITSGSFLTLVGPEVKINRINVDSTSQLIIEINE